MDMFDKLESVVRRFDDLTEKMANPDLYNNKGEFKKISEERSSLEDLVQKYLEYKKNKEQLEGAKELLKNEKDEEMREMARMEVDETSDLLETLTQELNILLLPKDPLDEKNVFVEIRAGAGGDEASLFVADMYRLYQIYFRSIGFKVEILSISQGDVGIKEIIFSVAGEKAYSKLKYESGVHRVQRVPKTESQGRVHTSTVTVAVMPEVDEVDFHLDLNEVRIDVYRSGGSGGQSVNTTDSAVRVTHLPTGTVVAIQDEKSQIKNKEKALKILKTKLYDQMLAEKKAIEDAKRKDQVGTGDRSERIRTYNFPQGRLTDHRIGLTIYNLDKIMEGNLGEVTDALIAYYQSELLKGQEF